VHHEDFPENIIEIENNKSKLQWSYETKEIRKPYFNERVYILKRILYTSKLAYYVYRNYLIKADDRNTNNRKNVKKEIDYQKIQGLLEFVNSNYKTNLK